MSRSTPTAGSAAAHDDGAMGHARTSSWRVWRAIIRSDSRSPSRCRLDMAEPILGIEDRFSFGDAATLPYSPFEDITRQAQSDFTLQDQRDNDLFVDGGMVTTQADWSLEFDVGMAFHEWHAPVQLAHEAGVFDRALNFSSAAAAGAAGAAAQLDNDDQSAARYESQNYPVWGPDRTHRHVRECRAESPFARRVADAVPLAALRCGPVRDPSAISPASKSLCASRNGANACIACCAIYRRNSKPTKD